MRAAEPAAVTGMSSWTIREGRRSETPPSDSCSGGKLRASAVLETIPTRRVMEGRLTSFPGGEGSRFPVESEAAEEMAETVERTPGIHTWTGVFQSHIAHLERKGESHETEPAEDTVRQIEA